MAKTPAERVAAFRARARADGRCVRCGQSDEKEHKMKPGVLRCAKCLTEDFWRTRNRRKTGGTDATHDNSGAANMPASDERADISDVLPHSFATGSDSVPSRTE